MFLDFERESNATSEGNTAFSIEIQREDTYEAFATSGKEDLEGDRESTWELFDLCRLGYITVVAPMSGISQTFVNRSETYPTKCQNSQGDKNRFRNHIPCTCTTTKYNVDISC